MKSFRYIAAVVFGFTAYAATPITTCTTIAQAGNYSVEADLISTGSCIIINASNVTLALNNHVITGPGIIGSVGVTVTPISGRLDHVGISGPGLIKGFANGILISGADYVQVSSSTAVGNLTNGIVAATSTFLTIASNVLSQNGVWGALFNTTDNSSIIGNEMGGNGFGLGNHPAGGLRIAGTGNTVSGNIFPANGKLAANTNTQNAGLVINTSNSRFFGNVSDGGNGNGIEILTGAVGNQVANNKALGNLGTDLVDDNVNCGTNLWTDNTFFTRNPASCVK